MAKNVPFRRAMAMMQAVAAIMASTVGNMAQRNASMQALGPYKSRGHGEGRSNRVSPGRNMVAVRAARKARNIKRHRASRKGA